MSPIFGGYLLTLEVAALEFLILELMNVHFTPVFRVQS